MGHQAEQDYLDRNNIDQYFGALAEEIKIAGIGEHRILIVGGAAMALKFYDGRSTVDIDICIREQNHLYRCCQIVAQKYNLPEDWINADVMHSDSFTYRLFDNAVLYKKYGDILEVDMASDIDLYCMKLISFRPKDIQDMEVLAGKIKSEGVSRNEVEENFLRLYGDMYLMKNDDRKVRYFEAQFEK